MMRTKTRMDECEHRFTEEERRGLYSEKQEPRRVFSPSNRQDKKEEVVARPTRRAAPPPLLKLSWSHGVSPFRKKKETNKLIKIPSTPPGGDQRNRDDLLTK